MTEAGVDVVCPACEMVISLAPRGGMAQASAMWDRTVLHLAADCPGDAADAPTLTTVTLANYELRILAMWINNWLSSTAGKPGIDASRLLMQDIARSLHAQTTV